MASIHHLSLQLTIVGGWSYVSRCLAASYSWDRAASDWAYEQKTTIYPPHGISVLTGTANGTSYVSTSTFATYQDCSWFLSETDLSGAITLCDGHPRVSSAPCITETYDFSPDIKPTGVIDDYPDPKPKCSINPTDCANAFSIWVNLPLSQQGVYSPLCDPGTYFTKTQNEEGCFHGDCTVSCDGKCTIGGGSVRLLYFPVPKTASRNMCATDPAKFLYQSKCRSHHNHSRPLTPVR